MEAGKMPVVQRREGSRMNQTRQGTSSAGVTTQKIEVPSPDDRAFDVMPTRHGQCVLSAVESDPFFLEGVDAAWLIVSPGGIRGRGCRGDIPLHLLLGREKGILV